MAVLQRAHLTRIHITSEHGANSLELATGYTYDICSRVFPSWLSSSRFPTKILFASPSILPVLATWPLMLIAVMIFGEECK
jgi:hypothetical protein